MYTLCKGEGAKGVGVSPACSSIVPLPAQPLLHGVVEDIQSHSSSHFSFPSFFHPQPNMAFMMRIRFFQSDRDVSCWTTTLFCYVNKIQKDSLITKISLLPSVHLKMSVLQWEEVLYLDWIHSLKGNSKLFKLVLFFKSFSLIVLEKDFFHKRKFSILILQLVVLRCPHKDAAYIEERKIRATPLPPHPELLLFCLKGWNYSGEVELHGREGLEALSAEHIASKTPLETSGCAWMAWAAVQPL